MKRDQHWADPIERPTPSSEPLVICICLALLCLVAVGMLAWRLWP